MTEPVSADKITLPAPTQAPPRPAEPDLVEQEKVGPLPGLVRSSGAVRRMAHADDPLGGSAASADVVSALQRRRGRGAPLDQATAGSFGQTMGADLSGVRVHTDSEADGIARSVQAKAFTHGSDLYFSRGTYDPSSSSGKHLLAHELTHVVQQRTGADRGGSGTTIGRANDPLETAADQNADRVVSALQRRASRATEPGVDSPTEKRRLLRSVVKLSGGALRRVLTEAGDISAAAAKIARGHAFGKHVQRGGEFAAESITTEAKFEEHVKKVMGSAERRNLTGGRSVYWDDASGTIVFHDPASGDAGTCFKPTQGKSYYDRQA